MRPPNLHPNANYRAKSRHSQQQNRSPTHSQTSFPTSSNNAPVHQRPATTLPTPSEHPVSWNGMSNNENSATLPPTPSFDELDHERSYLLNCLQHENFKATQLMRKITPLEEDLINDNLPSTGNAPSTKRKMRNQLGWFKNRLEQTARQERAILKRLGQLTFQIQKQVRVTQVELEYREFEAMRRDGLLNYNTNMALMQPMLSNFAPYYPTQYAPNQMQPSVPEWQQQHGDYVWQQSTPEIPSEDPYGEEVSPMDTQRRDTVDAGSCNYRWPFIRRTVSTGDADLDSSCNKQGHTCKPMLKRLSLPTIPGLSQIWYLTKEEQETARCGVGE